MSSPDGSDAILVACENCFPKSIYSVDAAVETPRGRGLVPPTFVTVEHVAGVVRTKAVNTFED